MNISTKAILNSQPKEKHMHQKTNKTSTLKVTFLYCKKQLIKENDVFRITLIVSIYSLSQ